MAGQIDGLITGSEGLKLKELAASIPDDGQIVEIGAYKGLSTSYLAAAQRGLIWSIDLWDTTNANDVRIRKKKKRMNFDDPRVYKAFVENTKDFNNVLPIKADSREIAKVWTTPIHLLFIDGAHDYESVKADFENFAIHVVPNGYVAFHDAVGTKGKVSRVIAEFVEPYPWWWVDIATVDSMRVFQRGAIT